jgi:uncharacterized protein YfiM (DUF2279 family)
VETNSSSPYYEIWMVKKKDMTGLDKKIGFFCFLILLSLFRISPGQNRSETAFSSENHEPDSLRISEGWLAWDKLAHLGVSAFLSALSYEVYHDFYNNDKESPLCFSSGLTLGFSLGKEIYDEKRPDGRFSYKDLVADIFGLAAGLWIATR